MPPRHRQLFVASLLMLLLSVLPANAAKTAFRITDMDWRDPHTYIELLGCRDVTDTPLFGFSMNGDLQSRLQGDAEPDSLLDLSYLIIFDPLDQAGSGGRFPSGRRIARHPWQGHRAFNQVLRRRTRTTTCRRRVWGFSPGRFARTRRR